MISPYHLGWDSVRTGKPNPFSKFHPFCREWQKGRADRLEELKSSRRKQRQQHKPLFYEVPRPYQPLVNGHEPSNEFMHRFNNLIKVNHLDW